LISQYSLVPTVRGLFFLAFVMMTIKFIATNVMTTETRQGVIRMRETRGQPFFSVLRGSGDVMRRILRSPLLLSVTGLLAVLSIYRTISGTFWSIYATEQLLIPPQDLALYQFARSACMLIAFFTLTPRLRNANTYRSMLLGFAGLIASYLILIAAPPGNILFPLAATVLEAFSLPLISTLLDKLLVVVVDPAERARIMALLFVLVILFTSPFGWIAGQLSELNRVYPFILIVVLFVVGIALTLLAARQAEGHLVTEAD
jgi:hypothetical protein